MWIGGGGGGGCCALQQFVTFGESSWRPDI